MYFERLLLTNKYEIYRFSREIEVITYLVFEDTFSKAGQAFGDAIYEQDFEANDNQIVVRCATLADFTEKDREEILSFCESMLSFKPSIDYCVDFFPIEHEITFNYPYDAGFAEMIAQFNKLFGMTMTVENYGSFNNLIQK